MEDCKPKSMAIAYALKKRAKKMAEGGMVGMEDEESSGYEPMPMPSAEDMDGDTGGGEEGIVDRIMKRFAKGGEVMADEKSADFDAMDAMPEDMEADYTGADSGDEAGDEALDEEDEDLVGRIMKSRGKKDKMPRPA